MRSMVEGGVGVLVLGATLSGLRPASFARTLFRPFSFAAFTPRARRAPSVAPRHLPLMRGRNLAVLVEELSACLRGGRSLEPQVRRWSY